MLISIRLERWSQDGTAGFEELLVDTVLDPRGWPQAGFEFRFADDAPYRVIAPRDPTSTQPAPRTRPAAVMWQQSAGLDGCEPNPWPLPSEIVCAARHDEPIAPPHEPDARATCGPDDV